MVTNEQWEHMEQLTIRTSGRVEMIDITDRIRSVVQENGIRSGICVLFVPHTTAALTINENADPDVQKDMIREINKIVPFRDGYKHSEGNSAAHIKSTLYSPTLHLIIENRSLLLGTWQGIYFCEFDGPRNRKLYVKLIKG